MNDVNVSALDRETKLFATIDELKAENERIRSELALIKPSWDDAPEWAKSFCVYIYWRGEYSSRTETFQKQTIHSDIQSRPKDDK